MNTEGKTDGELLVAGAIEDAVEPAAAAIGGASEKPRLLVENVAPDRTIAALRDILAGTGGLFDRGAPVRIVHDQSQKGAVAQLLSPEGLILLTHQVCRPYALKEKHGALVEVDVRLPRAFAVMYLDWRGEWKLLPLNGIASAPLLAGNGAILSGHGYDPTTGMWRERLPELSGLVSNNPSRSNAEQALRVIRESFRTFCFADAEFVDANGMQVIDIDSPPGKDESAFLAALLTAVCRPSVDLAPAVLIRAAPMSGAGAGKGLLARCIAQIAFGREPHAVTGGSTAEELEKRISAELIEGNPVLFLDNLNNTAFRSNLLASAITERPARVRLLGRSQMVPLNPSAFVVLTGNGLTVSEDLARRFITVELDPRTEDPEARRFTNNIRLDVVRYRARLLAAALTIWRWGRLNQISEGRPLGSFDAWCRWVRDPLLELGCRDPVERIGETKERDGRRQTTAEVFTIWWERHGEQSVAARRLHSDVLQLLDSQSRGRQYVSAQLERLTGTRIAGLMLTRQAPVGKWGAATYSMKNLGGPQNHRGHRGHRGGQAADRDPDISPPGQQPASSKGKPGRLPPMPPMVPMPSATGGEIDHLDEDELRAAFDERSATLEYDAGLKRPEAETRAAEELGLSVQFSEAAE